MAMWRIRINLADDAHSRARLDEVLANQRVEAVLLTPRDNAPSELSGDVILELPKDEALGEMLTALHKISPQVFVSRADTYYAEPAGNGAAGCELLTSR